MLKLLGLVGPLLRVVSGTIKPAADMIGKAPALLDDFAGKADKSPGKSSTGVLGAVAAYLGWDLGFLTDVGVWLSNVGIWVSGLGG